MVGNDPSNEAAGEPRPATTPLPTMFLGTHHPRLDDKGRVILPARFRERLADGLVVTRGQDRCLYVFAMPDFQRIAASMHASPVPGRDQRSFQRVFLSGASDELPDKQGRITVPPALRSYAGLTRDLAVIGAGSRVEIWDLPTWESYLDGNEEEFSDRSEEVMFGP